MMLPITTIQAFSINEGNVKSIGNNSRQYSYFFMGRISDLTINENGEIGFNATNLSIICHTIRGDEKGGYFGHLRGGGRIWIQSNYLRKIGIISERYICCFVQYESEY